jgi:hypothetical protein
MTIFFVPFNPKIGLLSKLHQKIQFYRLSFDSWRSDDFVMQTIDFTLEHKNGLIL